MHHPTTKGRGFKKWEGTKGKGRKEGEHFLPPLEKHSRTMALYLSWRQQEGSEPIGQRQQRVLAVLKLHPSNGLTEQF